jgi:hypothetical protein
VLEHDGILVPTSGRESVGAIFDIVDDQPRMLGSGVLGNIARENVVRKTIQNSTAVALDDGHGSRQQPGKNIVGGSHRHVENMSVVGKLHSMLQGGQRNR